MTEALAKDMMRCDVLAIDAWRDCEGGWTWNAWYKVGDPVDLPREAGHEAAVLAYGGELGFYAPGDIGRLYLDDSDQRNLVVCWKEDDQPIVAFDYGAHWEVNGL